MPTEDMMGFMSLWPHSDRVDSTHRTYADINQGVDNSKQPNRNQYMNQHSVMKYQYFKEKAQHLLIGEGQECGGFGLQRDLKLSSKCFVSPQFQVFCVHVPSHLCPWSKGIISPTSQSQYKHSICMVLGEQKMV